MKKIARPVLSIAIMFRNDIRCLERCLQSFQALREQIPCQIVMADTGSDDGSHAVAEQYADILFDFPWIDDFAAARNAVLERCSGDWIFTVDSDEWLDQDFASLVSFVQGKHPDLHSACVIQRNYQTKNLDTWSDFQAHRLLRAAAGPRYQDIIHEYPVFLRKDLKLTFLDSVILHHDGYIAFTPEQKDGKAKRNMPLMRKQLEQDPGNLRILRNILACSTPPSDFYDLACQAMEEIRKHGKSWHFYGADIFRQSVYYASRHDLPDIDAWAQEAEELFPESYFVRLDINFLLFSLAQKRNDYTEGIRRGEAYLRAWKDQLTDQRVKVEEGVSSLYCKAPDLEQEVRISVAEDHIELGEPDQATTILKELSCTHLNEDWTAKLERTLLKLQNQPEITTLVTAVWEGICRPEPSEKKAEERKNTFLKTGGAFFREDLEAARKLFLPLARQCVLGNWAAILSTENAKEITELLIQRDSSEENRLFHVPPAILFHALEHGVSLPLPGQSLRSEDADTLARILAVQPKRLAALFLQAAQTDYTENWQSLLWIHGLAMGAVLSWKKKEDSTDIPDATSSTDTTDTTEDKTDAMELFHTFAKVERAFLTRCYTADALENLCPLSAAHRFSWRFVQALDALDADDSALCVRLLKEILSDRKETGQLVDFLTEEVEKRQREAEQKRREEALRNASPELLQMAEQVRQMLSSYAPDDPAVAALKNSPVYRKLAYLIEAAD